MAIKKKISDLPESTDFTGLFTIGVNALNKSVKVSLEYIATKVSELVASVNSVITSAISATSSANSAAASANSAAATASSSASAADTATASANAATSNANSATEAANDAAEAALAATAKANTSATTADTATGNANAATEAANKATEAANSATEAATEITEECREVIAAGSLDVVPTSMALEYPERITFGNQTEKAISASLAPASVVQNILFLGDDEAVTVSPDGRLTVKAIGKSTIHVIPPANTSLFKTIQVLVTTPAIRFVNANTNIRFTSSGTMRLN